MTKQTALWLMIGGAALSVYDMATTEAGASGGALYGAGKPLESLRWKVYTNDTTKKSYYLSISDAAALTGAFLYFR